VKLHGGNMDDRGDVKRARKRQSGEHGGGVVGLRDEYGVWCA